MRGCVHCTLVSYFKCYLSYVLSQDHKSYFSSFIPLFVQDIKTYGSAQCTGVKDQYFDQITKIREYSSGQLDRSVIFLRSAGQVSAIPPVSWTGQCYSSGQLDRSVLRINSTITLIHQFQNNIKPMTPFKKKFTVLYLNLSIKILCALNTFLNQ